MYPCMLAVLATGQRQRTQLSCVLWLPQAVYCCSSDARLQWGEVVGKGGLTDANIHTLSLPVLMHGHFGPSGLWLVQSSSIPGRRAHGVSAHAGLVVMLMVVLVCRRLPT